MTQIEMIHDGWARRHRGKFLVRRNVAHLAAPPMNRAVFHRLGLSVGVAIALTGCEGPDSQERGILRTRLFQQCLTAARPLTPERVADRGSWSEIVQKCDDAAMWQVRECSPYHRECLDALPASAMSAGTAETPKSGSGRKPASAVGNAEAPEHSHPMTGEG